MSKLQQTTTRIVTKSKGLIQIQADQAGMTLDVQVKETGTDGYVRPLHAFVRITKEDAEHLRGLLDQQIAFIDSVSVDQPSLSLVA